MTIRLDLLGKYRKAENVKYQRYFINSNTSVFFDQYVNNYELFELPKHVFVEDAVLWVTKTVPGVNNAIVLGKTADSRDVLTGGSVTTPGMSGTFVGKYEQQSDTNNFIWLRTGNPAGTECVFIIKYLDLD